MMNRAFFLDRDGVLILDKHYLSDPGQVELFPGTAKALRRMRSCGYKIIAVSNQSGIARGYFTFEELERVQERIDELLRRENAQIDAWYYCPHYPGGKVPAYSVVCSCRKPAPGLILKAAEEQNIDLGSSVMIGDNLSDLQAGKAAGCGTLILLRTKNPPPDISSCPEAMEADTLSDALEYIPDTCRGQ